MGDIRAEFGRADGWGTQLAIYDVLAQLAVSRPVFHSEADFQHALAWGIHEAHPDAQIRLEYPFRGVHGDERLDIVATISQCVTAIELKYLTQGGAVEVNGELFALKAAGGRPQRRYDVVRDISRLERYADEAGAQGLAILLTDEPGYWRGREIGEVSDALFRLHEDQVVTGQCAWADESAKVATGRRNLVVRGTYPCKWKDYAVVGGRRFRVLVFGVSPSPKAAP